MTHLPWFCPICDTPTYNPNDAAYHYCGRCHLFIDDLDWMVSFMERTGELPNQDDITLLQSAVDEAQRASAVQSDQSRD